MHYTHSAIPCIQQSSLDKKTILPDFMQYASMTSMTFSLELERFFYTCILFAFLPKQCNTAYVHAKKLCIPSAITIIKY